MAVTTRERIVDVAMELFGRQGFKATSIVQIEQAAGLRPGSGGLYHHFRSKQAILEAGLERHLGRLKALRDITGVLTDLGDLRAELTVLARYILAELDAEADLLRVVLGEARNHPDLLDTAVDKLVRATYTGFADWLTRTAGLPAEQALPLAELSLNALFAHRMLRLVLGQPVLATDDEELVRTWVRMVHTQIRQ
jgi:AcrR family transcriptional regulator